MSITDILTQRMREDGTPFHANNNVAGVFRSLLERELHEKEVEHCVERLLAALLIDTGADHNTQGTARRVAKMYCHEIMRGRYEAPPALTTFPNVGNLDELVATGPITVRSLCSHHLCPILGKCWIGVVPGTRVVGLSKFNRIVDWFASRPQIQEELVVQIADYIEKHLAPRGVAVVIRATHTCMTWRGVRESLDGVMTTNVMRGVFRDKAEARAEFLGLVRD